MVKRSPNPLASPGRTQHPRPALRGLLALNCLAFGFAAASGHAQQDDAGITLIEPILVQNITQQPQGLTIDSTGNLVYSTGQGFSQYRDLVTLQFAGAANLGSFNGLDYNAGTGLHVGSGIGGQFAVFTDPLDPLGGDIIDIFTSGFGSAQAAFAADDHAGVFGQNSGINALKLFDYDGNEIASTQFGPFLRFNGSSWIGPNRFAGTVWELDTLDSYIVNAEYVVNGTDIAVSEFEKFKFEGFEDGLYLGFHQDNNHVWVGYGDPNTGQIFLLYGQILTCPADVNQDGVVDLDDLDMVLSNFGLATSEGDTNGDGVVDLDDLDTVLSAFGTECG